MALLKLPPLMGGLATAAAAEQWVTDCCRVEVDRDGNVLTPIPALMAGAVSHMIEAAAVQDAAAHPGASQPAPTRLHGCRPPAISVEDYAARLLRYCKNSPVCYVAAFAYMLRLQSGAAAAKAGGLRVDSLTAHRLMAVGAVVATKFYDDKFFSNQHYAQVAGVSLAEWNAMELDFLFRLDFRAHVSVAELHSALRHMQALAGDTGGLPRPPVTVEACEPPGSPTAVLDRLSESLSSASSADMASASLAASCRDNSADLDGWHSGQGSGDQQPVPAWAVGQQGAALRRSKRRCAEEAQVRRLVVDERALQGAVCRA